MGKWLNAGVVVVLIAALAASLWSIYRPGIFSSVNYERIRPGMTLAEVEQLLGEPGMPLSEQELPQVGYGPGPGKAPVNGDRYFQWKEAPEGFGRYILISLRNGVVADKYYWQPSL